MSKRKFRVLSYNAGSKRLLDESLDILSILVYTEPNSKTDGMNASLPQRDRYSIMIDKV